jgi:spore germination cell wall hydrolase CwlJ-like protein
MLVSITAQAGQEPGLEGLVDHQSLRIAAFIPASASARPIVEASLTLGSREDLSATPDEIDPNPTVKQGRSAFPVIDRTSKGDPFIIFRPGFEAKRALQPAPFEPNSTEDWPDDSRSPARVADIDPSAPSGLLPFGDGATPEAPLDFALNSSTPTPSDGKLLIAEQRPVQPQKAAATSQTTVATPQVTVATPLASGGKPDYASLIDPKDSARQMRCLGEAIYFEARSEPEAGQAAVAQVVLNRVRSGIFPTDVCAVVYQDRNHPFACQFSFACEGKSLRIEEPAAWATATRIAQAVVSGATYNPKLVEALNYHANYVYPFWAPSLRRVDRIGAHIFYAMPAGMNWAPGALNGRGDLPPLQSQANASPLIQTVAAAKSPIPAR